MIFAGAIVLFSTCYFKKGTQIMFPSQSTYWYLNRKLNTYLYFICAHLQTVPQHPTSSATKVHSLTYSYFQLHRFLYANSTSYTSPLWECLRGIIFTCNQRSVNNTGVCFWRLVMCTAGAGNACLERKGAWWSWDAVLPIQQRSPEPVKNSIWRNAKS